MYISPRSRRPITFALACHVDILARTRQAFEAHTLMEKRVRRICDRYLRRGLLIDLVPLLVFWPLYAFVDDDPSADLFSAKKFSARSDGGRRAARSKSEGVAS